MTNESLSGPIEDLTWPTLLPAKVVEPGNAPRIHGYGVEGDLAKHYGFVDTIALCVSGELPSDRSRAALEIALQFLAPAPITDAPAHAGMLTRLCGATRSAAFAAGMLTLAEEARFSLESYAAWLAALDANDAAVRNEQRAKSDAERASVARLREAIASTGMTVPGLDLDIDKTAAFIAIFHACGFRSPAQMELLFVLARFAAVGAEILSTVPAQLRSYPIDLPPYRFEAPHVA